MAETTQKRGGRGLNPVPKGKTFSKDYQPTGNAKSKGKKKKRFARELVTEMLQMPYKFAADSQVKKQLIQNFGNEIVEMTVGEVMTLQQMQKAIMKADTIAYSTLLDQAFGRVSQHVDLTSKGETINTKPVLQILPTKVIDAPNIEDDPNLFSDEV